MLLEGGQRISKSCRIEFEESVLGYLKENGLDAIKLLMLAYLVCFSMGLLQVVLFFVYLPSSYIIIDSAFYFLQSCCFAIGSASVSKSMPSEDNPLYVVLSALIMTALVLSIVVSFVG